MTRDVAIVGVGETAYARESGVSSTQLATEAITRALEDAGLEPAAIDGVITAHGNTPDDASGAIDLTQVRQLRTVHRGGASPLTALSEARAWLDADEARHVLVFRSRNGASQMPSSSQAFLDHVLEAFPRPEQRLAWEFPYGAVAPIHFFALLCREHMHRYGTTREQLGAVAIQHRDNAQRNPAAQTHGRPLTLEQYLAGRPISEPLHRYDCCLQSDGAAAFVVTTVERARQLKAPPVMVAGVAVGAAERPSDYVNRPDLLDLGIRAAATRAYTEARIQPQELDLCLIYDAFTSLVLQQLEELGLCERGASGPFVADGRTAFDGSIPVNPHGGLLAEAHMLGVSHVNEAVRQLRGHCGDHQVNGAEVAAVTGFGNLGEAAVAVLAA